MGWKRKRTRGTQKENKKTYPEGFDLLMCYGFGLSLLNVIFGLIPISIRGSKVSYSRISVVQLYGIVLFLTIVYASVIFVAKTTVLKQLENQMINGQSNYVPTTYILAITLNVAAHVLGFLGLMLRGQVIGKKIPKVWQLMSKAVEKSIVQLHGKKYDGLLLLRGYCRRIYAIYLLTLVLNELLVSTDADGFHTDSNFSGFLFNAAYVFWDFTTLSHVLTCMLLGFFMKTLEVCLMSVNESLEDVVEDIENFTSTPPTLEEIQRLVAENHGVDTIAQRLGFARNPIGMISQRALRIGVEEKDIVRKLNTIKDCYNAVEEAVGSISAVFGASIFIEVLIVFGSSLGNTFFLFKQYFFRINGGTENKGEEDWTKYGDTSWQPLADIIVQFFFFSSLAVATTRMTNEAKKSARIIRTLPYQNYPDNLQTKLFMLRNDLNSAEIRLTAADYFVVNKNLVITLCSTVVTFLVVLIQFNAADEEEPGRDMNNTIMLL